MLNAEVKSEVSIQHSFSIQHSTFSIAMRLVIVGTSAARARLSAALPEELEVVGETRTLAEARKLTGIADAWLVAAEAREEEEEEVQGREHLTPREREVLELLAQGLPNKTIAARLGISDQTVKFQVAAICGKLGAANRTDAARRALRLGVISL